MKVKKLSELMFSVFLLIFVGCTTSSSSSFHFNGDGSELLIHANELPSGWELNGSGKIPLRDATEWRNFYVIPKSPARPIVYSVAVFNQEKDAISYWDLYSRNQDSVNSCMPSPESYAYESDLADQFEIYCIDNLLDQLAYEYFIIVRYGNVVSTFLAPVIRNEDATVSEADAAGILTWAEMETLLKLIDEKFQQTVQTTQ